MEENEKKIQDVLAKLDERQINYEMQRHPAVDRIDQIADLNLIHPETAAKNLFLRDDKHQHYYLVSIMPKKRVDLKAFRKEIGARHLRTSSASLLGPRFSRRLDWGSCQCQYGDRLAGCGRIERIFNRVWLSGRLCCHLTM